MVAKGYFYAIWSLVDPHICVIFIPAWGSNLGSLGFSRNQNNRRSSGTYVTCLYCGLSVKIKHAQNAVWRAKIVDALVLRAWSAQTRSPPIWAPGLTTPLHGVVYEVWDLPCISVGWPRLTSAWPLPQRCITLWSEVLSTKLGSHRAFLSNLTSGWPKLTPAWPLILAMH